MLERRDISELKLRPPKRAGEAPALHLVAGFECFEREPRRSLFCFFLAAAR